mmetsp:Transcript_142286/g.201332  ORF Transcript_142286/g.201332 Transcript_142286/m.201332 type:complete len:315 (+) Transcript_142286:182-1126(+)
MEGEATKQLSNNQDGYIPLKFMRGSQFPVYMAGSPESDEPRVMKIFDNNDPKAHDAYMNDSKFCWLKHDNIIRYDGYGRSITDFRCDEPINCSFILMELASYGDFTDLMKIGHIFNDKKLVRTYFHQLIEGIEYLHAEGVAHLDLKTDNLLLCENFILKICDFDRAYSVKEGKIRSRGTAHYRAPEIKNGGCKDPRKADVFSAGVIAFLMLCNRLPFLEDKKIEGVYFEDALFKGSDMEEFFKLHQDIQTFDTIDPDFAELFWGMTRMDEKERFSLEQVKESTWYKEEIYTNEELLEVMQENSQYFKNPGEDEE